MDWYYAEGGQQRGPVSPADFDNLLSTGVIRPDTLVWREGMANWQPHAQVAAASAALPAGVLPPLNAGGISRDTLLSRDYEVDVGGCLSASWDMFKAGAGGIIGASVLVYLVLFAVSAIPYLGSLTSLIFTGPLMGGLWLFFLKKIRDEEATVGDAFGGFGPRFGQLVLAHVVPGVLAALCVLPLIALAVLAAIGVARSQGLQGEFNLPLALAIPLGLLGLVGMLVAIYLGICWFFAIPLVADKTLDFWTAMKTSKAVVSKHWWGTFWLSLVAGILASLGLLLCGVGLLVTGPVAFGMVAHHFSRVFGDLGSGT